MANTSYDDIWTEFITNAKTDDINLPNTPEKIYNAIHSAIRHFNNRMETSYTWDDDTEELNDELSGDYLILMAHYLRLSFLKNQLTDFVSVWNPFTKEIGVKNLGDQMNRLEKMVAKEESDIDEIILNQMDDYM